MAGTVAPMVAAMGVEATAVAPAVVMAAEAKAAVAEMAMGVAKVGSEAGGRRRQPRSESR